MQNYFLVVSLIVSALSSADSVTLIARVSVNDVKATGTLMQDKPGGNVTFRFQRSAGRGLNGLSWQLRTHRVNYDVQWRCTEDNIGPRYLGVNERVIETLGTTGGFDLSGINSIEGRSLVVLEGSNVLACATIESLAEYVTARAVFKKGILGHVTFRQLKSSATALTQVMSDLYFDGSQTSAQDLSWRIVTDGSTDCVTVGAAYDPIPAAGNCGETQHTGCPVGDLARKLGSVPVGATVGTARKTTVDLNLPVHGSNGIIEKILLLYSGETVLACAPIRLFSSRTGSVIFDHDMVTGSVTFTQPSPLDPTTTEIRLENLQTLAGSYHVHDWPVPQHMTAEQGYSFLCSADSVGGHFNPFNVQTGSWLATEDKYEVGDLSSKYKVDLTNANSHTGSFTDWNLPLFGHNSILGRSFVLHYKSPGSPRWLCGTIRRNGAVNVAMATFTYPVIGYIMFMQHQGDEMAETTVYTRLDYGDGSVASTSGHAWAIHENNVSESALSKNASTRCTMPGDVINPFNVSSSSYDAQCSRTNQARCKMGDLAGKHGAIWIRKSKSTPALTFDTYVDLPLKGKYSIIGKSVVIKAASGGTARLACADIVNLTPRSVRVNDWGDSDYGSVTFTQISGVIHQPTTVALDLNSLPASPTTTPRIRYLIHKNPISTSGDRCANVGLVYNPYRQAPPTGTVTTDMYIVGDLWRKFGALAYASVTETYTDPFLDVFGPNSVVGRALSMTLVRPDQPHETLGCGDIHDVGTGKGMLVRAEAVFTGDVVGSIKLSQYVYPDGTMTDTTVIVDLKKKEGPQTLNHNWHTHENPVGEDTADKPCMSTGGHYNPFMVNVNDNYDECSPANPLRCELGDQSNKLGTYNMGSGIMVATDVNLPLHGNFSVIGRSFVVHAEERDAPRIACADIRPVAVTSRIEITVGMATTSFNSLAMKAKVVALTGAEDYNIQVDDAQPVGDCSRTTVYFLGMNGDSNRQKFVDKLNTQEMENVMGDYKPVTCSSAASFTMASLVLLLTSYILAQWL